MIEMLIVMLEKLNEFMLNVLRGGNGKNCLGLTALKFDIFRRILRGKYENVFFDLFSVLAFAMNKPLEKGDEIP